MAWTKTWTDPDTGVIADYWEVIGIKYQHREQMSEMTVGVWVSAEAHASLQPVHTVVFNVPSGAAPELAAGALHFVTEYCLTQPEFDGAIKVGG